ncbi:MAG TPA: hypothetical protein VM848_06375 [Acidimicrobiia bacterium]|nr:hypothetical protein [Acidimicrobiia bacterium]
MSRLQRLRPNSALVVTFFGEDATYHRRHPNDPRLPLCSDRMTGVLTHQKNAEKLGLVACSRCEEISQRTTNEGNP